jgi:hypothetical protein
MYEVIQSEPGLFTVGQYHGERIPRNFKPCKDLHSQDDANEYAAFMNGGLTPPFMKPVTAEVDSFNAEFDTDHIDPDHYKRYSVEVIDQMVAIYGYQKTATFCELTAFKYRSRMGTKPGQPFERDLAKEVWFLTKADELRKLGS